MGLTIVSSSICPYALKVIAALYYKKLDFELKLIDVHNTPQWFKDVSPLEKVPILIIEDNKVLFESNVILDYIDQLQGPSLQPTDQFEKSLQRAKSDFANEIIGGVAAFLRTQTEEQFNEKLADLKWYFSKVETFLIGPYLNGEHISLADFAFAPVFVLLSSIQLKIDVFEGFPKIKAYSSLILALPELQKAKVADFDKIIQGILVQFGSYVNK